MKRTIFAISQNNMVGMISYNYQRKKKLQHIANIYGVYVTKEFRKQGVWKKLLEAALTEIVKKI